MPNDNLLKLAETVRQVSRRDVQVEIDRINAEAAPLRERREAIMIEANAKIAEAQKMSEEILRIEMPLRSLNRMLTRTDADHVPVQPGTVKGPRSNAG